MPISGLPTTGNDDVVTVTPGTTHWVDGLAGTDTLVLNWGSLTSDIVWEYVANSWYRYSDGYLSTVNHLNIERFFVTAGSGDDHLVGWGGADSLLGGAGQDLIESGLGADTVNGGGGTDHWSADYGTVAGAVVLTLATTGAAVIAATGARISSIERVSLTTGAGADAIDTSAYGNNDWISLGAGDDVAALGRGRDTLNGGAGIDTMVMDWSGIAGAAQGIRHTYVANSWYRFWSASGDSIDFLDIDRFNLTGGAGDDRLVGGNLDDTLVGNAGNDWLLGGAGIDAVSGGAGTDTWQLNTVGRLDPTSVNIRSEVTNFGATLASIERLHYTGGAVADSIVAEAGAYADWIETGSGDDTVNLGRGADTLNAGADTDLMIFDWSGITDPAHHIRHAYVANSWYRYWSASGDSIDYYGVDRVSARGGAGSDLLQGGGLNDTLIGNAGNDWLAGGAGIDSVDGGDGEDGWEVNTAARTLRTVLDLTTQTGNFGARLAGIERLSYTGGAMADWVTALAGVHDDSFSTAAGDDIIVTGRGRDVVSAGDGFDKMVVDWSAITDPGQGISTDYVANNWYRLSSASGDQVDYHGVDSLSVTGGAGHDTLRGFNSADTLVGNAGDDVLDSAWGLASIDGGAGNDHWQANLSNLDAANFNAAASQTTAQLGAIGLAVVGVEQISLTTGAGRDTISTVGYAFNDWVNSGDGNDTIALGLGHDTVNGDLGTDILMVDYSTATRSVSNFYTANSWYRIEMADGAASVDYYGIDRFRLTGGSGDDSLTGGGLDDTLIGGAGHDTLDGSGGADVINGGTGVDLWRGWHGAATADLSLTLNATGSGTLGGVGTTLTAIEAVGLTTGSGNDVIDLSARAGDDQIETRAGNDVINIGRGRHDWVSAGDGDDILIASFADATSGVRMGYWQNSWYRALSVAGDYDLQFHGVEVVNITGSARADRIHGFGAADTLSGGAGADRLEGGGGNDVLSGGTGTDVFVFANLWGAGQDVVTDLGSGDILRLDVGVQGLTAGTGGALVAGYAQIETGAVSSWFRMGLDGTPGADFVLELAGSWGTGNFQVSGGDLIVL